MSSRVCAVGEHTSKLAAAYLTYLSHDDASGDACDGGEEEGGTPRPLSEEEKLLMAFRELALCVSVKEVGRMLSAAHSNRPTSQAAASPQSSSPSPGLSWGEFCVFAAELQSMGAAPPNQGALWAPSNASPRNSSGSGRQRPGSASRVRTCMHEVFLGGSCNPTTWRKDVAIPVLQREGITYFNPQIDEWFPELIEIEEDAKQSARLQFFVIDNQTRAVASMVESAYFAGVRRDLVLVVDDIVGDDPKVGGTVLSKREVEDLNRGREFVRTFAEESGALIEHDVHSAIVAAAHIVSNSVSVPQYMKQHPMHSKHSASLGENLRLLRQVFTMYDADRTGSLSVQEAEIALMSLHIDAALLRQQLGQLHEQLSSWRHGGISFDEFCLLYVELFCQELEGGHGSCNEHEWAVSLIFSHFLSLLYWAASWLQQPSPPPSEATTPTKPLYDVFLGGSCGCSSWRTDTAIPVLRQYGVSYFNPQIPNWTKQLISIEQKAKEQCSVLLFVVTGDTLSVASMVEVAYYIGRGRTVILCIDDIPQTDSSSAAVEGMVLSSRAVKDYNRGRAYLSSIANKNGVPIYGSVADAALSAVYGVKGVQLPPMSSPMTPNK